MLSDKAKGKQRARGPEAVKPDNEPRELVVRFSEGEQDLLLWVNQIDTVRDVKRQIREIRFHLRRRRLRLIHSGRVLTDGTLIHSWLHTLEERQHRASTSNKRISLESATNNSSHATWVHCSIGPIIEDGEDETASTPVPQIQPLRGFDRLTAAGFSAEDVSSLRRQFHNQPDADYILHDGDDADEHARALEEQWIDQLDAPTLADAPSTSSSVLQGLILGFFFPILPMFFLWEPKPPVFWTNGSPAASQGSVVFSKRMQMGVVVGAGTNVLFAIWRYLLGST